MLTLLFSKNEIVTDLYFLDFVPFFADFDAFFFAAIFIYIEKDAYISFLILKIKKINLLLQLIETNISSTNRVLIFSFHRQ